MSPTELPSSVSSEQSKVFSQSETSSMADLFHILDGSIFLFDSRGGRMTTFVSGIDGETTSAYSFIGSLFLALFAGRRHSAEVLDGSAPPFFSSVDCEKTSLYVFISSVLLAFFTGRRHFVTFSFLEALSPTLFPVPTVLTLFKVAETTFFSSVAGMIVLV
jgi:hypothetical protein